MLGLHPHEVVASAIAQSVRVAHLRGLDDRGSAVSRMRTSDNVMGVSLQAWKLDSVGSGLHPVIRNRHFSRTCAEGSDNTQSLIAMRRARPLRREPVLLSAK